MNDQKVVPKDYVRLVHPVTGDFIAEYYPDIKCLKVTKHKKTATIWLLQVEKEYERNKQANDSATNSATNQTIADDLPNAV